MAALVSTVEEARKRSHGRLSASRAARIASRRASDGEAPCRGARRYWGLSQQKLHTRRGVGVNPTRRDPRRNHGEEAREIKNLRR